MPPIDIAKKLGLTSPQKVKNTLKSIPEFYRLDLGIESYKSYKLQLQRENSTLPGIKIEELEIVIGSTICEALRDREISEINLYPDGSLFSKINLMKNQCWSYRTSTCNFNYLRNR